MPTVECRRVVVPVKSEWSVVEIARLAGTTSRTLRHYGDVGLLTPTRIGTGGYRYYDEDALLRLQRILLLRELGLGIPTIRDVLAAGRHDSARALALHLELLEREKERLDRQIASVETTIEKLKGGEPLMAEEMFVGFDHTEFRDEVDEKWGVGAYRAGDAWWRGRSMAERREHTAQHVAIAADYQEARRTGSAADSAAVQAIVGRHVAWLNLSAEVTGGAITSDRLIGYGDLYVGDPRFARNYGGLDGAEFVREAFGYYAANSL